MKIFILDEPFELYETGAGVYIEHEFWSFIGFGGDFNEAYCDLLETILDVYMIHKEYNREDCTEEDNEMFYFAEKIGFLKISEITGLLL